MLPKGKHWHQPERIKRCTRCKQRRPLGDFYAYAYTTRQGKPSTRYESRCKPCARERRKERSTAHPGLDAAYGRKRRQNVGPEVVKAEAAAYRATEHGRRVHATLQRIRSARVRSGMSPHREDRLAVKKIYVRAAQLEIQDGIKRHVDHIIPLSRGGKHEAVNLQILSAIENMKKGANMPSYACHGGGDA